MTRRPGRLAIALGGALPGLTVDTGGKHTFASQYVGVQTRSGMVVLPAVFDRFPKPGNGVAKID